MSRYAVRAWQMIMLGCCLLGPAASAAEACAVCFGGGESRVTRGVAAGVLVLGGVVGLMLLSTAGFGLFCLHRSRRLERSDDAQVG